MSDVEAGAAPESGASAPASTRDIVADVVQQAEASDTGSSDSGESSTRIDTTNLTEEKPARAPGEMAPTDKELSAAAKFLEKQGHRLRKEDGRDNWLKASTVEGILDRYVGEHRSTWDGERTTLSSQAKQAQEQIDTIKAIFAGDPKTALAELATIYPQYSAFLEQKAAQAAAPENDPEPQPDFDLGNGNFTYTVAGLAKREAWMRRQMKREIAADMDERFKPIAEREKAEKQRADEAKWQEQLQARSASQMEEAQTWPLFGKLSADGALTEFQTAVLAELQKDTEAATAAGRKPTLSLEGAYIRASNKRISEDENTKRARILDEINKAPKSSALSRQGGDTTKTGLRNTKDVVRETIARLEAGSR